MPRGAANQPDPAEVAGHPALALPPTVDLEVAREVADGCRACDLWERATQTVFGEGRVPAPLMLLGEQPGDREDIDGRPFVGPAGRLLGQTLEEAGIDRERVFVTNVVKHFKWRPQGRRRLHERPNPAEIRACRPWLDLELELVRPEVLVMLGATAAQSILGRAFRVTEQHGELLPAIDGGPRRLATFHPSAAPERRKTAIDSGRPSSPISRRRGRPSARSLLRRPRRRARKRPGSARRGARGDSVSGCAGPAARPARPRSGPG